MVWYKSCFPVFQFMLVVPWKICFFSNNSVGWFLCHFIFPEEMPVLCPWSELLNWEKVTFCKLQFKSERSPNSEQTSETQHLIMFQSIPDYFWHPAFFFVRESPYVHIHRVALLQVLSVSKGTCSIKPAPGSPHHMIWSLRRSNMMFWCFVLHQTPTDSPSFQWANRARYTLVKSPVPCRSHLKWMSFECFYTTNVTHELYLEQEEKFSHLNFCGCIFHLLKQTGALL